MPVLRNFTMFVKNVVSGCRRLFLFARRPRIECNNGNQSADHMVRIGKGPVYSTFHA